MSSIGAIPGVADQRHLLRERLSQRQETTISLSHMVLSNSLHRYVPLHTADSLAYLCEALQHSTDGEIWIVYFTLPCPVVLATR